MSDKLNNLSEKAPRVFYDGSCGLCHYFVRFVLIRMKEPFIFSPLQGRTFSQLIRTKKIEHIPDSIVVYDKQQDRIYFKTEAVLYVLRSLGKSWQWLARLISCMPVCISNIGYNFIARIRGKISKKPKDICPIISQDLRKFFED